MESMQLGFSASPGMGGMAGTDPAAMRILSAVRVRSPSWETTRTCLGPVKEARPSTTVTPLAASRACTPALRRLAAAARFCCTPAQSRETPWTCTPAAAHRVRAAVYSSALWSSALVGMHPTFRQVPPILCSSTRVTCAPSWAARMAAT